ncbi:hypothetical protein N7495_001332 [Penicillium taxi]|uniref:uncharacterized protein n=1 Tax=Penicillium taxi TaxID=168475 RepID=UPI002544EBD8|nr:uncharacterized protein N7495_001332 [Penicillium taxi]KAJ5908650.1 hypothetical protein N7495_001332 [Penicillium taxi]
MGTLSDTPLPSASKMSRYRAAREASKMDNEVQPKVPVSRPTTSGTNNSSDQNPSIARSMSRYRRNRAPEKVDACATMPPIPARTKHQAAPPVPDVSKRARAKDEEEERLREIHRLNAMAQLTGGSQSSSDPTPSRSTKLEKQARQQLKREEKRPTVQAHEIKKDRQVETSCSKSSRAADQPQRRSFFQKVLQSTKNKESDQAPKYITSGGGGLIPGIDAPVSAVNAGERKVLVQYGDASTELVVTPLTTVQNLLHAAYDLLSKDINPETFILIESFCQVGLERPLRRYEHVRDVMNSWAHDADNRLIIIPPSGAEALAQVDAGNVSSKKPTETTVYVYYSRRPRKWDKRYVTLRADGQIMIGKKGNSTDMTNICHLSDFDIYSPNARALAKEIKPPKKICFAIKSQQKSSMFLSTENFLHFFTTNDRAEADKWYQVVQSWRSWYLVNELGAGREPEPELHVLNRSMTQKGGRQVNEPSLERQVGYTEPLINQATSVEQPRPTTATISPFARLKRDYGPSQSSYQPLSIDTSATGSDNESPMARSFGAEEGETGTFSPTGLLGRNYTQRQKVMREREKEENRAKADPFTGMLSGSQNYSPAYSPAQQNSRSNTMTHAPDTLSSLAHTQSTKKQGKPLVDLTPIFQEAPQHLRKGRAVHVEQGPLIDAATGPDHGTGSVAIPSATTWRRPDHDVPSQAPHRSNTIATARHEPAPLGDNMQQNMFEPHSLLSRARKTTGASKPIGHGVATGDRLATRPMLDVAPENPFAEGSLLRKL